MALTLTRRSYEGSPHEPMLLDKPVAQPSWPSPLPQRHIQTQAASNVCLVPRRAGFWCLHLRRCAAATRRSSSLGVVKRSPLHRYHPRESTPGRTEVLPSAWARHVPDSFRSRRSSRPQRFSPRATLGVCCTPQPVLGFASFQAGARDLTVPAHPRPPQRRDHPSEPSPRRQPYRVTATCCPPVVTAVHPIRAASLRRFPCDRPTSGPSSDAESVARPGRCHPDQTRCSPGLIPNRVFASAPHQLRTRPGRANSSLEHRRRIHACSRGHLSAAPSGPLQRLKQPGQLAPSRSQGASCPPSGTGRSHPRVRERTPTREVRLDLRRHGDRAAITPGSPLRSPQPPCGGGEANLHSRPERQPS